MLQGVPRDSHNDFPFNPSTAGADYSRFLHFLLARSLSAFKHIEDRM